MKTKDAAEDAEVCCVSDTDLAKVEDVDEATLFTRNEMQVSAQVETKNPEMSKDVDVIHQDIEDGSSQSPTLYHKAVFFTMGFAALFFWNCVLNTLYDIRDKVYPEYPSMTDTLNAVNSVANLLVALYTVRTGAMNTTITVLSAGLMALCCISTAICVQWIPGIGGVIILHLINVVAGASAGFFQTGCLALCSVLGSGSLSSFFSGGQGGCGVVSFIIWTILSQLNVATKTALWVLMSVGFLVLIISGASFQYLCNRKEIFVRIKEIQETLRNEAVDPDAPSYKMILSQVWVPCALAFWCFYITLLFFPNIGPMTWDEGDFTNYTLGTFQVGDLIGRYMPAISGMFLLSMKTVTVSTILRTVMIPLAILCWKFPDNSFWGNKGWHVVLMIILSVTNGWLCSSLYVHGPAALDQANWRSRAMSLTVLCVLSGISAGLWSARIFTAFAV